tara:strand:- start:1326 stop:1847 length:522 start_codon:yes stop_codon:yes gene_type:complete
MKELLKEWKQFINEGERGDRIRSIADKVARASDAELTKMAGDQLVSCKDRSNYLDNPNSGYQKMVNDYVRAMMSGDSALASGKLRMIGEFVKELYCNPQPEVDAKGIADEFLGLLMGTVAGIKSAERGSCVAPTIQGIVPDKVSAAVKIVIEESIDMIMAVGKGAYKCPIKKK